MISGERRLRASKIAGIKKIPAYIRIANDQQMLEMALVENIQRENLNPIEIALSYKRLIDEVKLTQEQCSEKVGKNRSTITNFLRLLNLPEVIQKSLKDKTISNGHARALLSVKDEESQINLFNDILQFGYSVRDVEQIAKEFSNSTYKQISISKKTNLKSFSSQKIEFDLTNFLNTKIQIKQNNSGKGSVVIYFKDNDDLKKELLNKLNKLLQKTKILILLLCLISFKRKGKIIYKNLQQKLQHIPLYYQDWDRPTQKNIGKFLLYMLD